MLKNIDKVFCITLDTSLKRQSEFKERFPELVNSDIFEWYVTKRDNIDPVRGCHNSHKEVLEIAKKRSYSQIITFEDDANLLVPWKEFVNIITNIKYPSDWEAIQLGYVPFSTSRIKDNNTIVSIICSICMHSYMSNVKTLNIPEYNGNDIDIVLFCANYKNHLIGSPIKGKYGIYPKMLIRQNAADSTIDPIIRKNQGSMEYNRDELLKWSTYVHILGATVFSSIIIGIVLFCLIIWGLVVGINKIK